MTIVKLATIIKDCRDCTHCAATFGNVACVHPKNPVGAKAALFQTSRLLLKLESKLDGLEQNYEGFVPFIAVPAWCPLERLT